MKLTSMHFVYAKYEGMKTFRAIDINSGCLVGNLIYASLIENTKENRIKLQRLAERNKGIGLVLQLRSKSNIVFQTN